MLVRKFHDQNGVQLSFTRQLPSFSLVLNVTAPNGGKSTFSASPDDLRAIAAMFIEAADAADRLAKT